MTWLCYVEQVACGLIVSTVFFGTIFGIGAGLKYMVEQIAKGLGWLLRWVGLSTLWHRAVKGTDKLLNMDSEGDGMFMVMGIIFVLIIGYFGLTAARDIGVAVMNTALGRTCL